MSAGLFLFMSSTRPPITFRQVIRLGKWVSNFLKKGSSPQHQGQTGSVTLVIITLFIVLSLINVVYVVEHKVTHKTTFLHHFKFFYEYKSLFYAFFVLSLHPIYIKT